MIKRCNNGHWYDTGMNKVCPHCKRESEKLGIRLDDLEEDDRTISIAEAGAVSGRGIGRDYRECRKYAYAGRNGFGVWG